MIRKSKSLIYINSEIVKYIPRDTRWHSQDQFQSLLQYNIIFVNAITLHHAKQSNNLAFILTAEQKLSHG